ncbi:MAG: hypothetical protein OES57_03585 [Acidimicrobiia bacterium]|nr:hypothetical protein [Acidimicrobiia bacterium]
MTDHAVTSKPAGTGPDHDEEAQRVFSQSILISGIRCTLTYVVFPFVAPIIGVASGVTSAIGIVVGVVAIVFNVLSIRRFWKADHRWKWPMSILNASVIVLLLILFVIDFNTLA